MTSEVRHEAADQFNDIIRESLAKPKVPGVVIFSNHLDDDNIVEIYMNLISEHGGVKEIWKPELLGIVISVDDYYLDAETSRILGTECKHKQRVTYLSTSGFTFTFGWNDLKPYDDNVDYHDFPEGFKKGDCIKVKSRGALIVAVERITFEELTAPIISDQSPDFLEKG